LAIFAHGCNDYCFAATKLQLWGDLAIAPFWCAGFLITFVGQ